MSIILPHTILPSLVGEGLGVGSVTLEVSNPHTPLTLRTREYGYLSPLPCRGGAGSGVTNYGSQ